MINYFTVIALLFFFSVLFLFVFKPTTSKIERKPLFTYKFHHPNLISLLCLIILFVILNEIYSSVLYLSYINISLLSILFLIFFKYFGEAHGDK